MANIKLSPPWYIRVREVEEMFRYDSEVHVIYDEDENELKLYVDNSEKACALTKLLPEMYIFGNVNLKVTVIPANEIEEDELLGLDRAYIFEAAFQDNGAFSFAKSVQALYNQPLTYVVFKKRVVQYFNDDLGDAFGQCSTLYQEIAKNVFGEQPGVYYSTDIEDPVYRLGSPLGEWP